MTYFSLETMWARRSDRTPLKAKEKIFQHRFLSFVKISFRNKGEIKVFSDEESLSLASFP